MLAGPAAFAAVRAAPLAGLGPEAHFAVAAYAWILAWWATVPVPWAVASFLPFVLLPAGGVMPFAEVAGLYGQPILPFLMGSMLLGHALRKHGLATRVALALLSMPGAARSSGSLLLALLVVAAASLAVLYGAAAGELATPIGIAFNPLVLSVLEETTRYRISFAQWTSTGVVLAAGVAATVLTAIAVIVLSTVLVPAFGAFSVR